MNDAVTPPDRCIANGDTATSWGGDGAVLALDARHWGHCRLEAVLAIGGGAMKMLCPRCGWLWGVSGAGAGIWRFRRCPCRSW